MIRNVVRRLQTGARRKGDIVRVLMIANNVPWSGAPLDGVFNIAQAHALAQRGHETMIVRCVPAAPPVRAKWRRYRSIPDLYQWEGIAVQTVRGVMGPRSYGIGTLRAQLRETMRDIAGEFRPDVVHVQGLLPSGLLALDLGIPFVLTAHGSETYELPWRRAGLERIARSVASRAARVVGVSNFVAEHMRRLGRPDAEVIFNGADERYFSPRDRTASRVRLGLPVDRPTIAYVGRVERAKGLLDLARASISMRGVRPHLLVAGEGTLVAPLRALLDAHGVGATWLGALEAARLGDVYGAADIFVSPSYHEGLPATLCEAMLVGRAIVATRVGGVPEILTDGCNGFLVNAGDVAALTERIERLFAQRMIRERFEREAHAFAREALTWHANVIAYEHLYRAICERGAGCSVRVPAVAGSNASR